MENQQDSEESKLGVEFWEQLIIKSARFLTLNCRGACIQVTSKRRIMFSNPPAIEDHQFTAQVDFSSNFTPESNLEEEKIKLSGKDLNVKAVHGLQMNGDRILAFSACRRRRAIIRQFSGEKKQRPIIGIVSNDVFPKFIDCSKMHGEIHMEKGSGFGMASFSPDGGRLVYIAEGLANVDDKFDHHNFEEKEQSWGEMHLNCRNPRLFVLEIEEGVVKELPSSLYHSPAWPCFLGDNRSIVYIGYVSTPIKPGIAHCHNRASGIYLVSVEKDSPRQQDNLDLHEGESAEILNLTAVQSGHHYPSFQGKLSVKIKELVPPNASHNCLRVSDGQSIFTIRRKIGMSHFGSGQIVSWDLSKIVNSFSNSKNCGDSESNFFETIHVESTFAMAIDGFIGKGNDAVYTELDRCKRYLTSISEHQKVHSSISIDTVVCHDLWKDFALVTRSCPVSPPKIELVDMRNGVTSMILIGQVNYSDRFSYKVIQTGIFSDVILIEQRHNFVENSKNLGFKISTDKQSSESDYEKCSNLESCKLDDHDLIKKKRTLVAEIHGGPNTGFTAKYNEMGLDLCSRGMVVAYINYTGSSGYTKDAISVLEGQIGVVDVESVKEAISKILKMNDGLNTKVVIMGGSHGGFLAAHLSSSFQEHVGAVIMRNPVTDLASQILYSDIPDWPLGQLGIFQDPTRLLILDLETIQLLHSRSPSPINVRVPTLTLIGDIDQRVPPFHGISWHRALVTQGTPSVLYRFPDADHSLGSPIAEVASALAIIEFIGSDYVQNSLGNVEKTSICTSK